MTAGPGQQTIVLLDRAGMSQPLKVPPAAYREPRISANGKRARRGNRRWQGGHRVVYDLTAQVQYDA